MSVQSAPSPAAHRHFAIGVTAYAALPGLVFVKVPNERARYILVEQCVAEVGCPMCDAVAGEPCYSNASRRKIKNGERVPMPVPERRYCVGTHYARRDAARAFHGYRNKRPNVPKPKLRISADDVTAALAEPDEQENPSRR